MTEGLIVGEVPILPSIEREFSPENLEKYGKACLEIGYKIAELIEECNGKYEGKIDILLPSRGAIPFFFGAMLALNQLGYAGKIELPGLACFDYLRAKIPSVRAVDPVRVLIFPFTADVNLSRLRGQEDTDEVVDGMRRFGARAFLDFLRSPKERKSWEFDLFLAFLEVVEGKNVLIDFYRKFPRIQNLIVIDTVISGRASWTIFDEWEKWEKGEMKIRKEARIKPILVIDKEGEKLKPEFRKYIDRGDSYCFPVPRILSEDQGAALEGVVAVVYPDLISLAHKRKDIYPQGYPLFGLWHSVPLSERDKYHEIFNNFMSVIEAVISPKDYDFEVRRKELCKSLSKGSIFSRRGKATIKFHDLNPYLNLRPTTVEETSSHVVQAFFSPENQVELINRIARLLTSYGPLDKI